MAKGMGQPSDGALIELNKKIQKALQGYLPEEFTTRSGAIRFDMIDKENLPNDPTVCVFLYDIQEDLELRHGQPRQYQASSGMFAPRQVHVRCCYLLTYWEVQSNGPITPDSQAFQVMNMALNALLNMQLQGWPSAFVRVIAPSEHLSSLGNFWQSLGDKPRLCLNFTVTIPIELGLEREESQPPVLSTELSEQVVGWEELDLALQFKRELVEGVQAEYIRKAEPQTDWLAMRAQLARLQVTCHYVDREGREQSPPELEVAGLLEQSVGEVVTPVVMDLTEKWRKRAQVKSALQPVGWLDVTSRQA
ncbi:DUF4255 domain-containing protein [Pseudomonas aeruginosa]|uniref:DUF4255 domain-containing protein n=1 Tax=Pseudomonas aeruginosa TaxID=287 RepID=UPI002ADD5261|nr:DUF4255 domain-containing protein [Pseudomonas aeruginosa]MEA0988976.1 DUF4255 domain-containing protein [Pseudomonas aeruginosa]